MNFEGVDEGLDEAPESSDPMEDAQQNAVQPDAFIDMANPVNAPIVIKLTVREHRHPRLYQWIAQMQEESPYKRGRGSPLPRVLEAALLFFMEWKLGLLEVRRKVGSGGFGGGGDVAQTQTPVIQKPVPPVLAEVHRMRSSLDLNQGRRQMRDLALEKHGVQDQAPVGSSSDVLMNTPQAPLDLSDGRLGSGAGQGSSSGLVPLAPDQPASGLGSDEIDSASFDHLVSNTDAF